MATKKVRKSIKKLFKSGSRKERKARKAAEQAVKERPDSSNAVVVPQELATAGEAHVDDILEVAPLPMTIDDSSKQMLGSSPTHESADEVSFLNESKSGSYIQIVLVLMDPTTRRFELLQLEFDSSKAIVADVLAQVKTSVTEATLREQTYTGICTHDGVEMINNLSLSQFCADSDVVLAIPEGTNSKDCARLAQPILGDRKVMRMLRASGIECPENKFANKDIRSSKKSGTALFKLLKVVLVAVFAVAAHYAHDFISTPLAPGDVLLPGQWRISCGLLSFLPSQETWTKLHLPESVSKPISCERAILKMQADGVLTLSGSAGWKTRKSVCDIDHPSCQNGLKVNDNGSLTIGGKQISIVKALNGDAMLTPWPFTKEPNVQVIKAAKYW